jgi:3-phenylpropionate/trans-cinnamate dioxygenase ferredoxin reductase subunit
LEGDHGRVVAVTTSDGQRYPAELVVVGIGAIINDQLALACGLTCDHGIVVDEHSRSSDPAIYAVGDCTVRRQADGSLGRLESVQNAVEQGKAAAAAIVGKARPFVAAPWFWSDQYDVKLQMVGRSSGHERVILRGDPATNNFAAFYFQGETLIAIDTINRPQDHMLGRRLLDSGQLPTPAQVADQSFALASLLKSG